MDKFIIQGGSPLNGEVTPSGNKNAALPLIAACLLTDEPVILHNVPNIRDVQDMISLLKSLGVMVEKLDSNTWSFHAKEICPADLQPDLCRRIRASILLAGPMVARTGDLRLPPPGGDVIGRRSIFSPSVLLVLTLSMIVQIVFLSFQPKNWSVLTFCLMKPV
jgi:UDP-N-acetylglucosamine 1-carboxyvinyltransferase